MPLLSALAAIGGLVSAGVSSGLAIDNAVSQPSNPTAGLNLNDGPATPTAAQQQQTITQQKAAVGQQLPNVEGLTSGYANPGYYAQQGATAAGTAGTPTGNNSALEAVEQAFGLPAGSLSKGGGGGAAPTSFPATGTGAATAGAFPNSPVDLSNFVNSFVST